MKYTTDEYVTDHDIRQFIEGLQLSFFVKECSKINDYILALMRNPLPAPNRTIVVTGQGEPPQGLEGVKGVFNILIVYYSLEHIPRESEETEESTIIKKRIGHHSVTVTYTHRKYGTDVCIRIDLNEFEPSVVAANEKMLKEVEEDIKKKEVATMFPNTKASGVDDDHAKVRVILDLDSIATKVTEMGATPFWGDLFRLIATEKGFGNGPQKVVFTNYPDSVVVGMGEFADDDYEPEVKRFKALDREMTYTTFGEGIVFEIPIKNEEKTNEQKEEPVMKTGKKRSPTPGALVWDKLNRAGLPNEAVLFIFKVLYGTLGLKQPTDERQVTIINRKDSFEIIYSHNGKPAVCDVPADFSITLADGTVVDGNSGTESAYYVVGKKKERIQYELLKKHARGFKLIVLTPKGHAELPYSPSIEDRGEEGIKLALLCNLEFHLKDGEFHNLEGPAYTAVDGRKNYIVNGYPVSEEEFKQLTNRGS